MTALAKIGGVPLEESCLLEREVFFRLMTDIYVDKTDFELENLRLKYDPGYIVADNTRFTPV